MDQILFTQEDNTSFFEFKGDVTLESILYIFVNYYMEAPTPHLVWVFSYGSIHYFEQAEILALIEAIQPYHQYRPEGRSAFVTYDELSDEMTHHFAELAQQEGHPQEFGFFQSREEAVAWINMRG